VSFDVFTVIAFGIPEAEQTFFENWIATVPKCRREAEQSLNVAQAK
jgi:hypothetical protein